MSTGGNLYFYHNDHLGAPNQLADINGNIVWKAKYEAFGKVAIEKELVRNNLRFPGQFFDEESGLYYNFHRFYDPENGRYISADPVGLNGGINLFSYTQNDPANRIDSDGLRTATNPYKTPERGQHGYWCGSNWTGGYERKSWDELTDGEKRNAIPPIDGMDSCCQDHDKCYGRCREQYPCDEESRADCFRLCDRALDICANNNKTGLYFLDRVMTEHFKDRMPTPGPNCPNCQKISKP